MKTRIELLDLWRSLCVFLMLGYHLLYDLAAFGYLDAAVMSSLPLRAVRGFGGGSFILISGAALCFPPSRCAGDFSCSASVRR